MGDIIHEAGWPIFPVLALGLTALALSIRQAISPHPALTRLIAGLTASCILMGVLGTSIGLQLSISGTNHLPPDERWLLFTGLREALNNLSVALGLSIPAVLMSTVGSVRMQQGSK